MLVYIPARGGSKRIPRKNIKCLGGKPVIAYVIEMAMSLGFVERVCVSTDDPEIQSVAKKYGAETGKLRSKELAGDFVGFITLIKEDVPRFVKATNDLLFILPTAALVQKKQYEEAYGIYKKHSPEILMATVKYPISPLWALWQDSDGYWKPLHPDALGRNSQDLLSTCVDAGLFYMMKLKDVQSYETLMVDKLLNYNIPPKYAVDVDTPEDWEILEKNLMNLTMCPKSKKTEF